MAEPRKEKTSLQNKIRKSDIEHLDTASSTWNKRKLETKIFDKSLETILRIAKEEMQNSWKGMLIILEVKL